MTALCYSRGLPRNVKAALLLSALLVNVQVLLAHPGALRHRGGPPTGAAA
jgi:hypothetical protein